MKIRELRQEFVEQLRGDYPREEVLAMFDLLVEGFLGLRRIDLALDRERQVSPEERALFETAVVRLRQHEPVQYILGEKEFMGMRLRVSPEVLIPRPETEELVSWVLEDSHPEQVLRILDIGTGSGCIAIALAGKLPLAEVTAIDSSAAALQVAALNAAANKVQINFIEADILAVEKLSDSFDVIVSNPPYVRTSEKKEMQRNVLDHEPGTALYVQDEDPLIFYKKISELASASLISGGRLYFEINQFLGRETTRVLAQKDFHTSLKKDIFGAERMLRGQKK